MSAGAILGLLGNVAGIAGQIPGLIPGEEERELERMTRGQGQGALQARQSAADAQRRAMSIAGSASRGGRGFALQQGLRAGTEAMVRGNEAAARVASQERSQALHALMQRRKERIQRGIQLGASVAGASGAMGAFLGTQDGAAAAQSATGKTQIDPTKYGNPAGPPEPAKPGQTTPIPIDTNSTGTVDKGARAQELAGMERAQYLTQTVGGAVNPMGAPGARQSLLQGQSPTESAVLDSAGPIGDQSRSELIRLMRTQPGFLQALIDQLGIGSGSGGQ